MDYIKSHNNKVQLELKEKAILNYSLSKQIGENVAALFDSKNTVSPIWEYYPELFKEEKENHEKMIEKQAIEAWKAKFEAFVNSKNKGKGVNR